MARLAIVTQEDGIVTDLVPCAPAAPDPEFLLTICAQFVEPTDPPARRVFEVYRLPSWPDMTAIEFWNCPQTIRGLLWARAEHLATVRVPAGRDCARFWP